jgi:GDP-mannose 6-dehydrogenase
MARVGVFGMGYVGCVSAACLARDGHEVIGVDINPAKLEALRAGTSPLGEPGLDGLIREGVRSGRLRVTSSAEEAVGASAPRGGGKARTSSWP